MKTVLAVCAVVALLSPHASGKEAVYLREHIGWGGYAPFNLGPTGVWAKRHKDCFEVERVDPGSPAHGLIHRYDVVTGVNGSDFPEYPPPRMYLGHAIINSEADDGTLVLHVRRAGREIMVALQLDPLPDYSTTWPFDCKRTNTLLTNACDYLAREQMPKGDVVADDGYIGPTGAGLLWLAMGEPQYLENARRAAYWFVDFVRETGNGGSWTVGYGTLLVAEYYHMTGDKKVLPDLQFLADHIAGGQMPSGGWSHGSYNGTGAGYGEVNCAGMIDFMALLLAKECGAKVDEVALRKAEKYYEKFAPSVTNRYGDQQWEAKKLGYGAMNGKVGGLAVAHFLNQKPEFSAAYALKAARSVDGIEGGHTGHFFNFLWTPVGASYAPANEYRRTMDQIGWYYALARTWKGGIYCQPTTDGKYSSEGGQNMTTGGYGLSLAVARRHLRIFGAPKSVFVQKLPAELEAARALHQSHQWDEAIAAVDAFLAKGWRDAEALRLAKELRDKARYVKEGMAFTYEKLESLAKGGRLRARAHKITEMLKPLNTFLGKDDPRLTKIDEGLPEEWRHIWRHGRSFHEAFTTLRSLSIMNWFVFAEILRRSDVDVSLPADAPDWRNLAEEDTGKGPWSWTTISSPAEAPEGWAAVDFDDSGWKKQEGRLPTTGYSLIRVAFEFDGTAHTPRLLRIATARRSHFPPNTAIYLNGEKVLTTRNGFGGRQEFMKSASKLVRHGRNVLAYSVMNGTSKRMRRFPKANLEADLKITPPPFAWSRSLDRDAAFRKLVARRRTPTKYYDAASDNRSVDELMEVFLAEPFFMPEAFYALKRFYSLVPNVVDWTPHVEKLLAAPSWGARWTGLFMLTKAMEPVSTRGRSKEDAAALMAMGEQASIWVKRFEAQVTRMLRDEHPMVRLQAATAVHSYGASSREAVPGLMALVADVDGQDWFTRAMAWNALGKMPLSEELWTKMVRTGLRDPHPGVRGRALQASINSPDKAIQGKAVHTFRKEMVEQVFDAPHGGGTDKVRGQMAKRLLEEFPRDELRALLPRFFGSMKYGGGGERNGCMDIIVSFGPDMIPKLKSMVGSKNVNIHRNALEALVRITHDKPGYEDLHDVLFRKLTPITKDKDRRRSSWAKDLLKKLTVEVEDN
jgi:hypothetical protein